MADDDQFVPLDTGDAVLLDAIGAKVIGLIPGNEVAIILDLEGRLNKLDVRDVHRYVMSAGLAAELIAELIVTGTEAAHRGSKLGITGGHEFAAELDAAIANEQQRRGFT
jgi:hypothetical protein